jgi:hypothetical protein
MSPDLSPLVFIGAMIALACALLGSLYLLIRHEPTPDKRGAKKIIVSNLK